MVVKSYVIYLNESMYILVNFTLRYEPCSNIRELYFEIKTNG